ncbi:MAG TPA: [protein-PII] uridylyltransferase [Acidimicrobiia bacterium]
MDLTPFSEQRSVLIADDTLLGPAFGRAYAAIVDAWLCDLTPDEPGIALLAGGALGRRELAPQSDLDLVLVHEGRRDVRDLAERIWYPIWDAGIALDHSVRTLREVRLVADDDLKVVLSLLDGRVVAGDTELGNRALQDVRSRWAAAARRRLPGLRDITLQRHEQEGDVAHLLSPELKQGKGGLRDLRVLHALEVATPVREADGEVERAAATILQVRCELHRVTGRPNDRLTLEEQDAVAARLGHPDADALMAEVSAAGRVIAWTGDDAWRRTNTWLAGPNRRSVIPSDAELSSGLALLDDEIDLAPDADFDDPSLLLRAAFHAADLGLPFRRSALEELAARAVGPGEPWTPTERDALVALLGTGEELVAVFEALDRYRLMARILPEWSAVRSRPQRNAFHRFTVDRHLIEAAVQASKLTGSVRRPDLLLIGAWLHDLGKGYPGDHTEAGVALMREIAPRMGFDDEDAAVLVALVEHHLLLPAIATSRDLEDPVTTQYVAERVRDVTTLELLAALTEADSIATGPTAWSRWKAELMGTLVAHVEDELAGATQPAPAAAASRAYEEVVARAGGALLVEVDSDLVTVCAPDQPGLLCRVVGLLSLHALSVRSADVWTSPDGVAVELLVVDRMFDRESDWDRFRVELPDVLGDRFPLEDRLAVRARTYPRRPMSAHPIEPRVTAVEGASETDTVLEVRARDRMGLLHRITHVLWLAGVDIRRARVSTLGQDVIDTFYLRGLGGRSLDESALDRIRDALLRELEHEEPVGQAETRTPTRSK